MPRLVANLNVLYAFTRCMRLRKVQDGLCVHGMVHVRDSSFICIWLLNTLEGMIFVIKSSSVCRQNNVIYIGSQKNKTDRISLTEKTNSEEIVN